MKLNLILLAVLFFIFPGITHAATDDEIRKAIIQESIASYPGPCACPYSVDRRGHACGGRSAYSRAGGYNTICYPKDVTDKDIKAYRLKN